MTELVPAGGWDTHIHIFDPESFPYGEKRSYTPAAAPLANYPSSETGCSKIVVVHASVQGESPAALLDTLSKTTHSDIGNRLLRGLATIRPQSWTDVELDELHQKGIRGVRLHKMAWGHGAQSVGIEIMQDIKTIASKTARLGWVVAVFCPLAAWAAMAEAIQQLDPRVKIVADHFGGAFPRDEDTDEFKAFLGLVRQQRLVVKLSGFERLYHGHGAGMDALEHITKAIVEAGPNQIIYGSDWPHTQLGVSRQGKTDEQRLTDVEGFRNVPNAHHIRKLRTWIPDDGIWQKLFVTNAEALFQ